VRKAIARLEAWQAVQLFLRESVRRSCRSRSDDYLKICSIINLDGIIKVLV
jgi:hypothetical protein